MAEKTEFDLQAAHRYFSAECFNRAWDLIEKPNRTAEEDEEMIRLSLAAHWHWTQRPDCTQTNVSIAYWQTSRVYALLSQADNARRYGQICLRVSEGENVSPFYLGYAYEALARAESVAGNRDKAAFYLKEAQQPLERIADPEVKKLLLDDLNTIR